MQNPISMDAVGLFPAERGLALGLIFVRNGAVTDGRAFYWPGLTFEDAPELLWSFMGQYYSQATPPPRVLLPWIPADQEPEAEGDGQAAGEESDGAAAANHAAVAQNSALTATQEAAQELVQESAPKLAPQLGQDTAQNPAASVAASPEQGASQGADTRPASTREALEQTLADRRGGAVRIVAPQHAGDNQLIDLAQSNAREEARRQEQKSEQNILERLARVMSTAYSGSTAIKATTATATACGMSIWATSQAQVSRNEAPKMARPESSATSNGEMSGCRKRSPRPGSVMRRGAAASAPVLFRRV